MTLDLKKAREVCTPAEIALVASARRAPLGSMTPRLVRAKLLRARALRDKFRDLAQQQAREMRGKAAPRRTRPARGNERTVEKAELFAEVLRRFEERVAALEAKTTAKPTQRVRRQVEASPRRKQRPAVDARKTSKLKASPVPRDHAHVSSRNRRQQARTDRR